MNNIHGACINEDLPERKGSGFVGHHHPNFIDFNDSWSQILNLQYDQNGSVFMIDWYDSRTNAITPTPMPTTVPTAAFSKSFTATPNGRRSSLQRRRPMSNCVSLLQAHIRTRWYARGTPAAFLAGTRACESACHWKPPQMPARIARALSERRQPLDAAAKLPDFGKTRWLAKCPRWNCALCGRSMSLAV